MTSANGWGAGMRAMANAIRRSGWAGCAIIAALGAFATPAQAEIVIRLVSFEYDETSGLLKKETIEPDAIVAGGTSNPDRAPLKVVTEYGLDAYGNRISVTVSGPTSGTAGAFTTRASSSSYATGTLTVGSMAYTHDAGHFATGAVNPLGHTESRATDPRTGQVVSATDTNGLTGESRYDVFGRKIKERRPDNTGQKIEYVYCTGAGITIPAGAVSDTCNSLAVQSPGTSIVPAYFVRITPLKGLSGGIDAEGSVNGPVARVYHDALNREVRRETQAFDGDTTTASLTIYKDTQYDSEGRVKRVSRPYYSNATTFDWAVTQTHDALGRVVSRVEPTGRTENGMTERTTATSHAGLTVTVTVSAGGLTRETRTDRDSQGRNLKITDAANGILTFEYDAAGNLTKTIDAANNSTALSYDVRGRKTGMADPDMGSWSYAYNALGEMTTQTDAKGQVSSMAYDLLGRMTQRSVAGTGGAAGMIAKWYYDAFPTGADAPPTSMTSSTIGSFTCNGATGGSRSIGKLCYAWTDTGALRTHSYDDKGRPDKSAVKMGNLGAEYISATSYNDGGRIAGHTYPTTYLKVKYSYTTRGYLKAILRDNPSQTENTGGALNKDDQMLWQVDSMDAEGRPKQTRQGHGVITENTWQAGTGRLARQVVGPEGAVLDVAYTYDVLGNLEKRNNLPRGTTEDFSHDNLNRLKTATLYGTTVTGITTTTWWYNAIGNITQRDVAHTVSSTTTTSSLTYNYPASGVNSVRPHAVSSLTGTIDWEGGSGTQVTNPAFVYDANGNMEQDANRTITWAAYNLPTRMAGAGKAVYFHYDAEYQRTKQIVRDESSGAGSDLAKTHYVNPAGGAGLFYERECLPDCGTSGRKRDRHYLTAGGTTVGVIIIDTAAGSGGAVTEVTQFWHLDHLGSLAAMTRPAPTTPTTGYDLCETFRYEPFGGRKAAGGTPANCDNPHPTDRGFTGHEHVEEMNLVHMNGRVFDPVLARFLSPDPFVQAPANLQNYNRYSYTLNNPLIATDPSGHWFWFAFWAFVGSEVLKQLDIIDVGVARAIQGLALGYMAGPYALGKVLGPIGAGAVGGFVTGLVASNGNPDAALRGALTGGIFGAASMMTPGVGQYAAHAVAGCVSGEISGGSCGRGAASAVIGKFVTNEIKDWSPVAKGIATVIAGGTSAVVGGGKFSNGAFTAAFGYLFNCSQSHDCRHLGKAVINSTAEAVNHYYKGSGTDVTLGPDTTAALENHSRVLTAQMRLSNGVTSQSGSFSVDLTGSVFHVGQTNVDYSTSCAAVTCTTNFVGFVRDGFWDPRSNIGGDRLGPKNELGGTPFRYKAHTWNYTFPNPANRHWP
jgi:RHS repeat-associated protein